MALPITQLFAFPPDGEASNSNCQLVLSDLISKLNTNIGATIAAGTANRLAYYTSSTAIGALAAITASRALASDSNGLPVASSTTAAELLGLNGLTASRAVVTTAGGILTTATTTATEIGFVNGVTSAIQTQLNGKASTALSNLASVAVNTAILPASSGATAFGSSSFRWTDGFFSSSIDVSGSQGGSHTRLLVSNTSNTASSISYLDLTVAGTSAGDAYCKATVTGVTNWVWGLDNSDGDSWVLSTSDVVGTNNAIRVSTAGEITQPLQPSFLVTDGTGATDVTGDGTAYTELWPTEIYDQGGDFASNTFTAPVTGRYLFTVSLNMLNILTTHTNRRLRLVTSNRTYQTIENSALAYTRFGRVLSVIADMDANDTATVVALVEDSTKTVDILDDATSNFFSGTLIN